jgi:O-antigen ligase
VTVVLIFNLIGLILTNSRNGWAIAILAFIAFAIYLSWYWLVGITITIVSSISWASFGNLPWQNLMRKIVPDYFWIRLSDQMYEDRYLPTLRISQWRFCLQMTGDRPLLGWGLRNFTPLYEEKTNIYLGHPHNLFLMFSAETGIVGVFCLSAIIAGIFGQAIQAISQLGKINDKQDHLILFTYLIAFSACVLFNCLDVSIFDFRVNMITWFLLACISGFSDHRLQSIQRKENIDY